jgi:hypothetical protein
MPSDVALDTYTVDASSVTSQAVTITNANVNVLVGTGTIPDCLGSGDSDDDGYTDAQEFALGKAPFTYCAIMRADIIVDGRVNALDLVQVGKHFLESVPPAPARVDQNGDAMINALDLVQLGKRFLQSVSDCP